MRQLLLERRKRMLRYYRIGTRPSIFLSEMAKVDGVYSQREFEKLKRDWGRRKGPDGWLRKIAFYEAGEDLNAQHILEVRRIREVAMITVEDNESTKGQKNLSSYVAMSAESKEREYMGLEPVSKLEPLTPEMKEEIELTLKGDELYNIMMDADREKGYDLIEIMLRKKVLTDIDLNDHL